MRKSLRYATVLFFLSLLSIVAVMGTDIGIPLGVGGPLEDVRVFNGLDDAVYGVDEHGGDEALAEALPVTSEKLSATSSDASVAEDADAFFVDDDVDGLGVHVADEAATNDTMQADAGQDAEAAVAAQVVSEPESRPIVVTHVINAGETLWDIARMYNIDIDTIVAANDWVDANRLRIGDKLEILTVRGALHTVQRGESLWDISRTYGVSIDEIATTNSIADPARLQVQTRLVIPGGQAQAAALRRDQVVSTDGRLVRNFEWPLQGRISSRYGPRWDRIHHGLDVAVPIGTPVRAAAGGVVSFSGAQTGYGNIVIIDHGNGVETRYAHTSRNVVTRGQRVQRGALIAYSGNTGVSTGPHLHFEIRLRGQSVNPELYLK